MQLPTLFENKSARRIIVAVLGIVLIPAIAVACAYGVLVLGTIAAPTHKADFQIPHDSYADRKETIKGEPINLVIVGIDLEKEKTFEKMDWTSLQDLRQEKLRKAVTDFENNITPISARYLFGRVQDLAYQGPDSTIWQRHHVRLWKDRLPDGTLVYDLAASYDQAVGLAPAEKLFIPTHVVAPDIDTERDALARQLAAQLGGKLLYTDNSLPVLYHSNGDNAWYYTDGMVIVISKNLPADAAPSFGQKVKRDYFYSITQVLKAFGVAQ